jgi:opacity protein-like surface antigen
MRSVLLISVSAVALVATPAAARNGAWYVGGDFGATIVEDVPFDFGFTPTVPGHDAQVVLDHDYGFDGALFVGYDLGAFRLEAEVSYKTAGVKDIETSFTLPSQVGPAGPGKFDAAGGHTSALSFMVNGMLDFGDDDGVSGFVGGGVGIARVDYNNVRAFANHEPYIDDADTRFAWQVVAGLRTAISDNIDVTVKYRFFNVGNIRTVDYGGFESESRFRSHSLLGGITFNFGAPPPPPPPPPPPEVQTNVPQPPLPPAEVFKPQEQQEPVKGENG